MSAVDAELRRLAQERVDDTILAMAQFRFVVPENVGGGPPLLWLIGLALWKFRTVLRGRGGVHLPNPAYLAMTESVVYVFSARFGGAARIAGRTQQWPRSEINAWHWHDNRHAFLFQLGENNPAVEIEAADPSRESATLIDLLCGDAL